MDERRSETAIGLVIALAIVILVGGSLWLSGRHSLTRRTYRLSADFTDVSGLRRGDPATLAGVQIGKASGISLVGGRAQVEISVYNEVAVPADSRAHIETLDLVGEKAVVIVAGQSDAVLRHGDRIATEQRPPLTQTVDDATQRLMSVLGLLETSLGRVLTETNARRVNLALADVSDLLATARQGVEADREGLTRTITTAERVVTRLDTLTGESQDDLRASVTRLHRAAMRLDTLVVGLDGATRAFANVAYRVERGEGTLGKLVAEDRAYTQLLRTIASVDSLIADIKAQPARYFRISVF